MVNVSVMLFVCVRACVRVSVILFVGVRVCVCVRVCVRKSREGVQQDE